MHMEHDKTSVVCKPLAAALAAMAISAVAPSGALADAPDALTFMTGGDLGSTKILSIDANSPDTVFSGVSLDDYEPAYAYFNKHTPGGDKWSVCTDIEQEILRPYNVVRDTENGASTMTVQFQGVTRMHPSPYTASITVKFLQSGSDVKAYVVRAASLKPLDIELGLDIDAMVSAGNPRAVSRPLAGDDKFNLSLIAMRKTAAPVAYTVHDGDTFGGTLAGNSAVIVTNTPADEASIEGYMPAGQTFRIPNHDLADLDGVDGTFHVQFDGKQNIRQTAYNLKYSQTYPGQKTCQFQYDKTGENGLIACLVVQFWQDGDDVVASVYNQWRGYNISKSGYEDEVVLGMDFEKYGTDTLPKRNLYSNIAQSDSDSYLGVKDLTLKFRSRARTVWNNGFFPNSAWTVVAQNQQLSDLVQVDGYFHRRSGNNVMQTAYNLKYSSLSAYAGNKTCQFQNDNGNRIECLHITFKQNGNNVEAYTGNYRTYNILKSGYESEVVLGMDFESYDGTTTPSRATWNSYATEDSHDRLGIRDLRLYFNSTGVAYSAASMAQHGNGLTFAGNADAPLAVKTTASTVFPTNGVVTVGPYATLTLDRSLGAGDNFLWRQYRVMTNGTLGVTGTWRIGKSDQIDLVGGTLALRECDSANDSGSYVSYVTLMNGACVRGKPARVGEAAVNGNWIVAGDEPSYCESGVEFTAASGDTARTFAFNVNDVAEGSDFIVTGDLVDYGTLQNTSGYWNVHVVKDGPGTMELSGDVTLPNEISVNAGALRLAGTGAFRVSRKRSAENGDGSGKKAEIWLAGGALETVAGATNSVGKVVAKTVDAPLNLGDGSKLTLESYDFDLGSNLMVSENLGNGASLHIEGRSVGEDIRGIRCGAARMRVRVGKDGNLEPYVPGLSIILR